MTLSPQTSTPKISVVMPVMNEERYIGASIDSILNQTFSDFEFLIIDDGSTDTTPEILAAYAAQDSRIRILRNDINKGISRSLNIGLKAARGDYIARMDGDDLNTPDRLEKQAALLDRESDVIVAGAGYKTINAEGAPRHTVIEGVERWECSWLSIFRSTILHSIMMYRREPIIDNGIFYDPAFDYAEDVEFTHRLLRHGEALCLPEVMLIRRFHEENTSSRNRQRQREAARRAAIQNATQRFPEISAEDIANFFAFLKPDIGAGAEGFADAIRVMGAMEAAFAAERGLDAERKRKMRTYSARWLAAAALSGNRWETFSGALRLAAMAPNYAPRFASESVHWAKRRMNVKSDNLEHAA